LGGSQVLIEWASDGESAFGQDVGIDHCGTDVMMTKEFLNGADIIALFEEVGSEGVAEGMTACILGAA